MGLLDDAIKEHLDLQRRRGADPAEVERAQREALGPVRRAPIAQDAEVAGERRSDDGFAYDHEDEEAWEGQPPEVGPRSVGYPASGDHDLESEFDDEESSEAEPEPEPRQRSRPSRLARIFGKPDPEPEVEPEYDEPGPANRRAAAAARDEPESSFAPEPADAGSPAPHPASPRGSGAETMAYNVEPALGADQAGADDQDEDVLEETPEFLQDTPDHDRLWFEQRPPRDFDFDR